MSPNLDLTALTRAADTLIRLRAILYRLRPEDGPAVAQAATIGAELHGVLINLPITSDVERVMDRVVALRKRLMALAAAEGFPDTSIELRSLQATARELYALLGDLEVQASNRFRARHVSEMAEAPQRQAQRHGQEARP